jgi:hypothetical protein
MSFKPKSSINRKFNWRPTLFSLAVFADLALAAGARYKAK